MQNQPRFFARLAAANLDSRRIEHLVRRGYAGCELASSDIGYWAWMSGNIGWQVAPPAFADIGDGPLGQPKRIPNGGSMGGNREK